MTATQPPSTSAVRPVWLIARRELRSRLRSKSFVIGTLVTIAVIGGYLMLQGAVFSDAERSTVGLNGQATALAGPLTDSARSLGLEVSTVDVPDLADGERRVADEELDVLVSGAPANLHALVRQDIDDDLRNVLDGLMQRQVLVGQLAEADPEQDPQEILRTVADATVDVRSVEPPDPERGQRLGVALVLIGLLYFSLLMYGSMVAQGVIEEKSTRVVEILLATVKPWQLLAGKVIGIGLVGLAQLTIIGGVGLTLASVTGVITISGIATGSLIWGLVWYLLGYTFYALVFAAGGALVSRQEEAQAVLAPVTMVVAIGFVLAISLLPRGGTDSTTTLLSLIPPLSPMFMPGRIALGAAPMLQIVLSLVLTMASIVAMVWLGGRIYRSAVLRMGTRVKLREVLTRSR